MPTPTRVLSHLPLSLLQQEAPFLHAVPLPIFNTSTLNNQTIIMSVITQIRQQTRIREARPILRLVKRCHIKHPLTIPCINSNNCSHHPNRNHKSVPQIHIPRAAPQSHNPSTTLPPNLHTPTTPTLSLHTQTRHTRPLYLLHLIHGRRKYILPLQVLIRVSIHSKIPRVYLRIQAPTQPLPPAPTSTLTPTLAQVQPANRQNTHAPNHPNLNYTRHKLKSYKSTRAPT